MTCTFHTGTLSNIIAEPFLVLRQPLVQGSRSYSYALQEGHVLLQVWELENCQVHYCCAGLSKAATFEIRHEGPARVLILNLAGKLAIQEYQSDACSLGSPHGLLLINHNIQSFCTFRHTKQISRVLMVTYTGESVQQPENNPHQKHHPFILPAGMVELVDKILYTSYFAIRHFHRNQFAELLTIANQSVVHTSRDMLIEANDLEVIHEIKNLIDAHIDKDHLLDDLARKSGLHTRKLNLGFRSLFNKTIYAYVREQRLHAAHEKIETTHRQLKLIGRVAGYRSYSNFSTAFRTYFGITPVSLRKK